MNNHKNLIYHLEELAANAWPARITQTVGGWRLRYTDGITRRANSVWPNLSTLSTHPEKFRTAPLSIVEATSPKAGMGQNFSGEHPQLNQTNLAEQLATVENFYAQRNLPARFQICPAAQPPTLDETLTQRGYQKDAPTNVQTTSIATILKKLEIKKPKREKIEHDLGTKVTINQHLNDAWFESYCQAEALSTKAIGVRRGILQRIAPVTGFAHIAGADNAPAALGLGVVERGWLGIFCMTTKPEYRRRGLASTLLHALADWANQQGATNAYLQVMVSNKAAQKLYTRVSFETRYQYYYKEL